MRMITSLAAGLLAAGITAASGIGHVAQAQQGQFARTVAIHYGDLDLGSAAGRETLDRRIHQAVRSACGEASPADLHGLNEVADCRRDLSESLVQRRDLAIASAHRSGAPATLVARR